MKPYKSSIEKYPEAFITSQRVLDFYETKYFPFNIKDDIEHLFSSTIYITTKSEYIEFKSVTNDFSFSSSIETLQDGRTYYDPNRDLYLIVYNEDKPINRTRFTLAHEFGHIMLHHLTDKRTEIDRGGLSNTIYYRMEGEANSFAGNLLVPPIIIYAKYKNAINPEKIANDFNLSFSAVQDYRLADYTYWSQFRHCSGIVNL